MFDTTIVINIYLSFLFPLEMQIPVIICLGHPSLLRCRTVRHILSLQKVIFEWMNETSNHSFYLHWLFFLSFFFFFLTISLGKLFPLCQSLVFLAFFLYPHSLKYWTWNVSLTPAIVSEMGVPTITSLTHTTHPSSTLGRQL